MKKMMTINQLRKLLPYAYWCANGRPQQSWSRKDGYWREFCRYPRVDLKK